MLGRRDRKLIEKVDLGIDDVLVIYSHLEAPQQVQRYRNSVGEYLMAHRVPHAAVLVLFKDERLGVLRGLRRG